VDDVRPYLEQATVCVGPLRFASGVQNKLLEALAMEVPVVTTPVAADGLRVEGGEQPPVLVADGEKEFAESVVYLLTQTKDRSRLAAEGRHFVKNHFNWSHSAKMLEEMCLTAVSGLQ
jgi:glycosyltransferase involved in cell wall biosynthesis